MLSPTITSKPEQLFINRGTSWPSAQREVGDGMESCASSDKKSIGITTPRLYQSSNVSESCSVNSSPTASPLSWHYDAIEDKQSPLPNRRLLISPTPSSASAISDGTILNKSERFLQEEKAALKDHLQIQIQVNQELKRLLVASVGEDLGYHFERLSTEKAQLTLELDEMKKQVEMKNEDVERLEISCDIWRSKFHASRMQCDDLSTWCRQHERQVRELESGVRGLLREHWDRSENLNLMLKSLSNLNESMTWEIGMKNTIKEIVGKDHISTVSEKCLKVVNVLSSSMLGNVSKLHKNDKTSGPGDVPAPTPAEKYVLQLLSENQRASALHLPAEGLSDQLLSPTRNKRRQLNQSALDRAATRLHSYPGYENVALNCCTNCKGDIHVV